MSKITKDYIASNYQPEEIIVESITSGSESYAVKSYREDNVFNALTVPRSSSTGSSESLVLLDLSLPHSISNVSQGQTDNTYLVYVVGTNTFGNYTTFGLSVPSSWIDITVTEGESSSETILPPPVITYGADASWNSGAHSWQAFNADGYVEFSIAADAVQCVVGLNQLSSGASVDYLSIDYAIYAVRGEYRIIENGSFTTSGLSAFTSDSVFKIKRIDGQVRYYLDDVLIYISLVASNNESMVLDASLYFSGDTVTGVSVTNLETESVFASGNFYATSSMTHGSIEVGGVVTANKEGFVSLSQLLESRNSILSQESFVSTSSMSASYRELSDMNAEILPLSVLASEGSYGAMDSSLELLAVQSNGALMNVSLGSMEGIIHPLLPNMSGLTGGNSLNTTPELKPLAVLASEGDYASMSASLEAFSVESFTYASPTARPEVRILTGSVQGSGTLLHTRKHILTAAHVIGDTSALVAGYQLDFFGADLLPFDRPKAKSVTLHPNWDGDFHNGNDLAIIELESEVTWINGVEVYQESNEIGAIWSALSYSPRVDPITGNVSASGWDSYANRYDDNEIAVNARLPGTFNVPAESMLGYDYDNGTTENDAYGVVLNIHGTGVDNEGIATPGDSGSARLIDGRIAGIASYSGTTGSSADINISKGGTYGDFALDVRVSYYAEWILNTVGDVLDSQKLVIDNEFQGFWSEIAIEKTDTLTAQQTFPKLIGDFKFTNGLTFENTFNHFVPSIELLASGELVLEETFKRFISDISIEGIKELSIESTLPKLISDIEMLADAELGISATFKAMTAEIVIAEPDEIFFTKEFNRFISEIEFQERLELELTFNQLTSEFTLASESLSLSAIFPALQAEISLVTYAFEYESKLKGFIVEFDLAEQDTVSFECVLGLISDIQLQEIEDLSIETTFPSFTFNGLDSDSVHFEHELPPLIPEINFDTPDCTKRFL